MVDDVVNGIFKWSEESELPTGSKGSYKNLYEHNSVGLVFIWCRKCRRDRVRVYLNDTCDTFTTKWKLGFSRPTLLCLHVNIISKQFEIDQPVSQQKSGD